MAVNMQRRKSVMARSIKLGHCVCDPQKPCPCPMMKEHNVCTCAGERMPAKSGPVALTRHVHKAGCASKIGQADLLRILGNLPPVTDPNVLVGTAAGDDAGVYRLDDRYSLVQTVDVFTPCVDDPYLFGQIAAANSLSDVYAMGGRPLTALSIIGFPIEDLDGDIMEAMLRGGIDTLNEAGCALVGGHSINDQEIKLGFAVTGIIESGAVVERDRARPGDAIVLTKPLGTGMVSFAAQIGRAGAADLAQVGASMATLNRDAAELMVLHGANACTDVTGYALAGHLVQMVRGSGVRAEIDLSRVPVFEAAQRCLNAEILSGAIERNQEYAMAWVEVADSSQEGNLPIIYDPQTSGGLLITLPEAKAKALVRDLHDRGHTATAIIGRIVEMPASDVEGRVVIVNSTLGNIVLKGSGEAPNHGKVLEIMLEEQKSRVDASEACCCDGPPVAGGPVPQEAGEAAETLSMFMAFMKAANAPGLIDARQKKLMAIALSISGHCEPCLNIHLKSALDMGLSWAEIDEAANLAVAFGGCTAMMFYKEVKTAVRRAMVA
jgi:selenide,water dikinase